MDAKEKCKQILAKMYAAGYTDVGPAPYDNVDSWTAEEIDYFLANYETAYLKEVKDMVANIMTKGPFGI